jgi:hypothetical protein
MFAVTTNSFMGIHRDHHGCPDLVDDHLPERRLGNVWTILSHKVTQNKGVMTLICFWNWLTGANQKSSTKIRKSFEGFRKEFQSNGELNKEVIDIN